MKKFTVEQHFDKIASGYDYSKNKHSYYYESLKKLLGELIPKNKTVLEFGCGTGDLLASLNPKMGYGVDISSEMISIAKDKYKSRKNLHFSTEFPSTIHNSLFTNHRPPDFIFMSDVIEHLEDPRETLMKISELMDENTIFINTMANPLWEPVLMIAEKLKLKMPEGPHIRLSTNNLKLIINNSKLRLIKHDYKLLMPIKIPFLTNFVNKHLEKYFKKLAFIEYFVAVTK